MAAQLALQISSQDPAGARPELTQLVESFDQLTAPQMDATTTILLSGQPVGATRCLFRHICSIATEQARLATNAYLLFSNGLFALSSLRRFSALRLVAQDVVGHWMPQLRSPNLQDEQLDTAVSMLENVLLGYQPHSSALFLRFVQGLTDMGDDLHGLLDKSARLKTVVYMLVQINASQAGSLDQLILAITDPSGNPLLFSSEDIERALRKFAWVRAGSATQNADAAASPQYAFPWPEGRWRLEGNPHQGSVPEFYLHSSSDDATCVPVKAEAFPRRGGSSTVELDGYLAAASGAQTGACSLFHGKMVVKDGETQPPCPISLLFHPGDGQQQVMQANTCSGVYQSGSQTKGVLAKPVSISEHVEVTFPVDSVDYVEDNEHFPFLPHRSKRAQGGMLLFPYIDAGGPIHSGGSSPFTIELLLRPHAIPELEDAGYYRDDPVPVPLANVPAHVPLTQRGWKTVLGNGHVNIGVHFPSAGSPGFSLSATIGPLSVTCPYPHADQAIEHVAVRFDGSKLQIFLRGVLAAESDEQRNDNASQTTDSTTPMFIGAAPLLPGDRATASVDQVQRAVPRSAFTGIIAEVRVWTKLRSENELREYSKCALPSGELDAQVSALVAYWPLLSVGGTNHNVFACDFLRDMTVSGLKPRSHGILRWTHQGSVAFWPGDLQITTQNCVVGQHPQTAHVSGHFRRILPHVLSTGSVVVVPKSGVAMGSPHGAEGLVLSAHTLPAAGGFQAAMRLRLLPNCNTTRFTIYLVKGSWFDLRAVGAATEATEPATGDAQSPTRPRLTAPHFALTMSIVKDEQRGEMRASFSMQCLTFDKHGKHVCGHTFESVNNCFQANSDTRDFGVLLNYHHGHLPGSPVLQVGCQDLGNGEVVPMVRSSLDLVQQLGLAESATADCRTVWFGVGVGGPTSTDIADQQPATPGIELASLSYTGKHAPSGSERIASTGPPRPEQSSSPSISLLDEQDPMKLFDMWTCVCTMVNPTTNSCCSVCGSANAGAVDPPVANVDVPLLDSSQVGMWSCAQCTYMNAAGAGSCAMCGVPRSGGDVSSSSRKRPIPAGTSPQETGNLPWTCPMCTLRNEAAVTKCVVCNSPKPAAAPVSAGAAGGGDTAAQTTMGDPHVDNTQTSSSAGTNAAVQDKRTKLNDDHWRLFMQAWEKRAPVDDAPDTFETLWDSTLGQFRLSASGKASPCLLLDGWYGSNHCGEMRGVACMKQKQWSLVGSWDQWCKDEKNDLTRVGGHYFEAKLDETGGKVSGNWWFGSAIKGDWVGELVNDVSVFRGLHHVVPPPVFGLDGKPSPTTPPNQTAVKSEEHAFAPFHTGLVNMKEGLTNVCYQNSYLQCLFATDEFRGLVLNNHSSGGESANDTHSEFESSVGGAHGDEGMSVSTSIGFHKSLGNIFAALVASTKAEFASVELQKSLPSQWRTGRQMDVSDFSHLVMQASDVALKVMGQSNDAKSGVDRLFGCTTEHILQCTACGKTKSNSQTGTELAVPLPRLYTPITGITAVVCRQGNTKHMTIPDGYERLRFNLNHGKPDAPRVYLCVERDPNKQPVTEVTIRRVPATDAAPATPEGYVAVKANLNTDGILVATMVGSPQPATPPPSTAVKRPDQVFLFYQTDPQGSPITEIQFIQGSSAQVPEGFRLINVDMNPGAFQAAAPAAGATGSANESAVRMCYSRGMPITDVVIDTRAPQTGNYHLVDTALNSALVGLPGSDHDRDDVYLWCTDSAGRPPITHLFLCDESMADERVKESAGVEVVSGMSFPPAFGKRERRVLMKERGQGCPITQVEIFKAPKKRSKYRNAEFLELVPPMEGSDLVFQALQRFRWIPKMQAETPPSGMMMPRGVSLQFLIDGTNGHATPVEAVVVQGAMVEDPGLRLGGVMYKMPSSTNWRFRGKLEKLVPGGANAGGSGGDSTTSKSAAPAKSPCFVQFELSGNIVQNGSLVDHSVAGVTHSPLSGMRVNENATALLPIVAVSVLRAGETMPHGYEHLPSHTRTLDRLNVNLDSDATASYIIVKRANPDADTDQAILDVKVFIAEVEPPPEGYEIVQETFYGGSADLNLGTNGSPMFLCVRRASVADLCVLYNMRLQWQDKGEEPEPGFKSIKYSSSGATAANLCMTANHTLLLCLSFQERRRPAVPFVGNGLYNLDNVGAINLYAVTEQQAGMAVTAHFVSRSSAPPRGQEQAPSVEGIMVRAENGFLEGSMSSMSGGGLSSTQKKASLPRQTDGWVLHGSWGNSDKPGLRSFCSFQFDEDVRYAVAQWNWGNSSAGLVEFFNDDFLELAPSWDFGEYWTNGSLSYSDRCAGNGVQDLVSRSFSPTVLGGANRPSCDSATCQGAKKTHKQFTVMTKTPTHLCVSIKRMGYDWKNNRAVKEMDATPIQTTIQIPDAPVELHEYIGRESKSSTGSEGRTYGLYAIIVHNGQNANSGHYFAYCRSSSTADIWAEDSKVSPWILLNDTRVEETTWKTMTHEILSSDSDTTYLMFYRRLSEAEVARAKTGQIVEPIAVAGLDDETNNMDVEFADEAAMLEHAIRMSQCDVAGTNSDTRLPDTEALAYEVKKLAQSKPAQWQQQVSTANERFLMGDFESCTSDMYRKIRRLMAKEEVGVEDVGCRR